MKTLLILWIGAMPVMHDFDSLAQCERVRQYAVRHENHVETFENGRKVMVKNVRDSACVVLDNK